jgi:DNA-binding GntR family transcriptional regulator
MSKNAAAAVIDAEPVPVRRVAKPEPRKGSLHQDAVAELRKMIVSGEFLPGERLREVAVSQRLGMSRTPLREAFRTLAAEGLVNLLPNRSVVVSELDPTEAADVFALLGSMEALAAQQACKRMTNEEIAELGQLQAEMRRNYELNDRTTYNDLNRRVHELMVEGSKNLSLILAWRLILPRADRARRLNTLDRASWAEFLQKHQQIYDALAARNANLLSALMQDHFDHAVDRMTRRLSGGKGKGAV